MVTALIILILSFNADSYAADPASVSDSGAATGEISSGDVGGSLNEQADGSASDGPAARSAKKPKGRIIREMETDGSQAANRFDSKNFIESKYRLNGEPLEVDPD